MSIDHGKLLALADEIESMSTYSVQIEWATRLRVLAQPAEAVDGGLGRFGHHPDPATDFEVEVESLQGRLFNARHGIAKMGEQPETVGAVTDAIERAMRFKVGGDPGAVYAKSLLRALVNEATTDAAHGQPVVDEAMVERAMDAFASVRVDPNSDTLDHDLMRAALTAALTGATP